jgi:hypothetical protein
LATTPPTSPPLDGKPGQKPDPRDDAFIREVDEAYREDELKRFVSVWGRWILLALVAGLAALGGWFWWQAEQQRRAEALSEQYSAALTKLEAGGTTEAVAELDKLGRADNPGYRALATIGSAGVALSGGEADKAAAALRRVVADPEAPQPLKDLATMKLLRLEFDRIPPAEVLKRTQPFLAGDSPWFPVAAEMAALAHIKAGSTDQAGPLFFRIASDERAPQSLRARAEQMAAALGQDVTRIEAERQRRAEAAATEAEATAAEPAAPAGAQ